MRDYVLSLKGRIHIMPKNEAEIILEKRYDADLEELELDGLAAVRTELQSRVQAELIDLNAKIDSSGSGPGLLEGDNAAEMRDRTVESLGTLVKLHSSNAETSASYFVIAHSALAAAAFGLHRKRCSST